jgi:AcrR family transcriptional regulator
MKKTRESLNRPGTARYPKGKERVEKILNAAKNVLVKEGYGGLTMRNVALGAGTTVGNLQYYYADKDRLLHDMLEYMVTGFFEDFSAILQDPKRMAEEKLVATSRVHIRRVFSGGQSSIELWAVEHNQWRPN